MWGICPKHNRPLTALFQSVSCDICVGAVPEPMPEPPKLVDWFTSFTNAARASIQRYYAAHGAFPLQIVVSERTKFAYGFPLLDGIPVVADENAIDGRGAVLSPGVFGCDGFKHEPAPAPVTYKITWITP